MKKIYVILTLALALFASVFVCNAAYAESVAPWNVQVTVQHEGQTAQYDLSKAICGLEEQAQKRGFYLSGRGKAALAQRLFDMQLPLQAVCNYILPDFDKLIDGFKYVECERVDAKVSFGKTGFSYTKSQDGVEINAKKLFEDMLKTNGKQTTLILPLTFDKAVTVSELKRNTVCRGTFTTSFASSGANRSHNIRKAASCLNGVTVYPGKTFSFNEIVGDRTEANGYKSGKVILNGSYTDGVGGGVCQVSTTLYNALLLSGFVPAAVPHSLVSSYVKAGFDAMVSYGSADLTFINNTEHPLYIESRTDNKQLTFTVYGEPNPYKIVRENEEMRDKFATTYIVDSEKYPELIYTDQTKVVVGGSDGVKTKSYLNYYRDGLLVERKLIRTNSYKKVDAVIARGYMEREE